MIGQVCGSLRPVRHAQGRPEALEGRQARRAGQAQGLGFASTEEVKEANEAKVAKVQGGFGKRDLNSKTGKEGES